MSIKNGNGTQATKVSTLGLIGVHLSQQSNLEIVIAATNLALIIKKTT
jgi:hypothetical protein